jgi:hypothetical protein
LVGAQIFPTNFLAAYIILVFAWLVAKILVANGILPTFLTLPSKILPIFWLTCGQGISSQYFGLPKVANILVRQAMA